MTAIPINSWWHRHEELEKIAKAFDPAAKLRLKKSRLWNVGALKTFATTFGRTVYIPADWSFNSVKDIIPHEVAGHVKQARYFGLGIHPTLGLPLMALFYLLLPFPIYFAWFRYRLELHADTQAWRVGLAAGTMTIKQVKDRAERFARTVSGSAYIFAWPRPLVIWGFKRRAKKVVREYVKVASGN